jgi:hypothetical protein
MPEQYVSFSAAWFTLSLINAGLAQGKGRSGLNWWLVSLLLPLATLLIVASPSIPAGEQESRSDRMSRTQAVLIGLVILVVAFSIFGLVSLGSRP